MAFVVLNAIFLGLEIFYLPALPFLILVLWLAFASLDKFFYLIVFFIPLSVPLTSLIHQGIDVDLSLPTEPMIAGVMVLFFFKYFQGQKLSQNIINHPVSYAIYFHIIWMLITTFSSSMPVVSLKFLIARIWFIVCFYFIAAEIFRNNKRIRRFIWLYIIPFTLVIFYAIIRHSKYGLDNQMMAHAVVKPFYNDHTAYGMALGMLIPVLIGLFIAYFRRLTFFYKVMFLILIAIYFAATVFSYTRATWLSLAGIAGLLFLFLFKIRWQYVLMATVVLFSFFFAFHTEIMLKLERNRQDSSGKLAEHVQSMTNVQTDASNLERINRWNCAIRMFKEKPVFGWGPGTYMFKYAPFQNYWEKTSISTNMHNLGNAHSEYLGPLAEQGIGGFVSIVLIIYFTISTGIRVYIRSHSRQVKILALSITLSLMTYYIHGVLNNFLDSDKASALFWGFTAILVSLDLKYVKKEEPINR